MLYERPRLFYMHYWATGMEPVSPGGSGGFHSSARNCPSRDQPLTDAPLRRTIGVTRVRQVVVTLSRDERGERPKSGRL
jgi:hypothetical protein